MSPRTTYCVVAVLLAIVAARSVHADVVVYSTIDPNTTTFTFGSGISYPIYNHPPFSPPGAYDSYVDQFSPGITFQLSTIAFGVRTILPNAGALTAVIYANNPATNLPLTSVPLATSTALAPAGTNSAQTVSLTTFDFSSASFVFVSGVKYWVGLEPAVEGTDVDWGYNTTNTSGLVADNPNGTGYKAFTMGGFVPMPAFGAFRISAVPEPSAFALLTCGALVSSAVWLRRRSTSA